MTRPGVACSPTPMSVSGTRTDVSRLRLRRQPCGPSLPAGCRSGHVSRCGVVQVHPDDVRPVRDDLGVRSGTAQPAPDGAGRQTELVGDRPVSLPVCCGCERFPDGLDAVGSTRERSDRHEHVAAVAVSTASASWGHPVDAATKQAYWPGACGAPGADVPRTVGVWAGVVAAGDAFGGGFGIEHKQQVGPFLECDRLLG